MKWTFVVAIAGLMATALNSCDTSDPVASPEVSVDDVFAKANCSGRIPLDQNIPLSLNGPVLSSNGQSAYINGGATYSVAPSPILVRDMVSVSLEFNAVLQTLDGPDRAWIFSGRSTDQVQLSAADPTFLTKAYRTPALSDGSPVMTLYVRYEVTNCKISVHSMWAAEGGVPGRTDA